MKGALVAAIGIFLVASIDGQTTESTATGSPAPTLTQACPELCTLPPERGGRGKASLRWYFNSEEKECKRFRYVGRNGNKNRFWKKEECESNCKNCTLNDSGEDEIQNIDVCNLPISKGHPCQDSEDSNGQLKIMWGFDLDKQTCEAFAYYGCKGNDNRFDEKQECEKKCLEQN